jgi:prepilin-type N-terminal cleavage/methylation domain-containing protein
VRRGYTLIEIIITVAITGILSVGMFKAFEAITTRSEKAKILSVLSIDSQTALDQISLLLYDRAPMSIQGCVDSVSCVPLDQATNATILQWYGTASESYQSGAYSGFLDIKNSQTVRATRTIYTPNTTKTAIDGNQTAKWGITDLGLVFAGTFEDGDRIKPYTVTINNNNKIVFDITDIPDKIYEKYYLVDSAYAVTLKKDAPCAGLNFNDNDLLLFYNYRPWKTPTETMCSPSAKVSLLSKNVNGFVAHMVNETIRLGIDMNRTVGNDMTKTVRLSKQKVVF